MGVVAMMVATIVRQLRMAKVNMAKVQVVVVMLKRWW